MNNKKLPILLILTISLWISTFGYIVDSGIAEDQARLAWSYESEGISVQVYAPSQAYPGDVVPITVTVNATAEIRHVYVILWAFSSKYENCSDWNSDLFNVSWGVDLHPGVGIEKKCDLQVPSDVDPGLVYGHISCQWKTILPVLEDHSEYDSFSVTYLKNEAFEEFQNKYEELNASYSELKSKRQGELGATRNLMYVFVATTIISAATVFILLMRRPRRIWV